MDIITRTEEILLLSVWRLQEEAYGLAIRKHAIRLMEKKLSVSAVYIPLERLKKRGFLTSWESEPTDKRGGRRKRFYKLTPEGLRALQKVKTLHEKAWAELPDLAFSR